MMPHRLIPSSRLTLAVSLLLVTILTTAGDWPSYLHDAQRTANGADETFLNPNNASRLTKLWSFHVSDTVGASAVVVGGTVYVGSWNGYEYALDAQTGALKWQTYLGVTPACTAGESVGIDSTATVTDGVVYVGGGDSNYYALDATTGITLWNVYAGDNSRTGGHYNWASPLIYNGYEYIGTASLCDEPLVQSQLLQVDLATHQIVNTFDVVPPGLVGGSIWTSPSVDPATNTIYVTTGNEGQEPPTSQPYTVAMVALDATTLAVKSVWQVPVSQQVSGGDSDWTTTPILFSAAGQPMVAAVNKNGYLYAFNRNDVAAGPVWSVKIARAGNSPESGNASVSSAAFGQGTLYQAGGGTLIHGQPVRGSIRALNPGTGQVSWAKAVSSTVIAPLAYANGLLVAATGPRLEVRNATNGALLYSFTADDYIVAAPSVSNGIIYDSSRKGTIYAFGLPPTGIEGHARQSRVRSRRIGAAAR